MGARVLILTLLAEDWVTQGLMLGEGEDAADDGEGEVSPVAGDGLDVSAVEGALEGCEVGVNPHHPPAGTRHINTPFLKH